MIQRLVWNFEFSIPKTPLPVMPQEAIVEDVKWELRFFWPQNHIITLYPMDNALLDLANYELKQREDYYYLLPDSHCNIKNRRGTFLYKPVVHRSKQAIGFGPKIDLQQSKAPDLQELLRTIQVKGKPIAIKKELFLHKFNTIPPIKLELARLEVNHQIFFSACIEGKSLYLVETLGENLLDKHLSCDYVSFLKNIVNHDD